MRILFFVVSLWLATSPLWGKIVFYSKRDGNAQIYTMGSDGSNQTRLTFNDAGDGWPTWSPNGQQIAFSSDRDGNEEVYVIDADGSNIRNLTRHPAYDGDPHWHPDGKRIVFVSSRGAGIYTMDTNGGNIKLITEIHFGGDPKWSPDGKRIAFTGIVEVGEEGGLYVVDAEGTNLWRLPKPAPIKSMPLADWSPDGHKILYTGIINPWGVDDQSSLGIATLNPTRREVVEFKQIQLPKLIESVNAEGWGPEGRSILFSGWVNNNWEIFRVHLSDGEVTQLTDSPDTDYAAHEWNPRLSVRPLTRRLPVCWGRIKSAR